MWRHPGGQPGQTRGKGERTLPERIKTEGCLYVFMSLYVVHNEAKAQKRTGEMCLGAVSQAERGHSLTH